MDDARALRALDEVDIRKVRADWAYARDKGDWEVLRGCFHPDATACLSWYNGPAEGFVEGSKRMLHTGKDYAGAHMIASSRVKVNGDRAILESDVQYFLRDRVQGFLTDAMMQMLFYDQMEKRDGVWRIYRWTAIYNVDRVDPVVPMGEPKGFYDDVRFDAEGNGVAMMRSRGAKGGRPPNPWIVIAGTEKERKVRAEGEGWFTQGGRT
jgi:hypothetical protein